jgi:phage shock protein C
MIAGVCGGIGEFAHIDSTLIRILFVLFMFAGGMGIFLYLAMIVIVPETPVSSDHAS